MPVMASRRLLVVLLVVLVVLLVAGVVVLVLTITTALQAGEDEPDTQHTFKAVDLMTRDDWLGRLSRGTPSRMTMPVDLVIIHHTAYEVCTTKAKCKQQVKRVQNQHMDDPNFRYFDIGYNFLVGADGLVYEGRGWDAVGAHLHGWNQKAVGVAILGTFTNVTAPPALQTALYSLLQWGESLGKLTKDYGIIGACQVRATKSPGRRFMGDLCTWSHWRNQTSVSKACTE
ncbi:peptidoglycan-recognition protein [Frankliniella occidentalis]|nr:peptidoglycan-recognition protein [Frankliniella occidentalis]